jgi:hypothetical protein
VPACLPMPPGVVAYYELDDVWDGFTPDKAGSADGRVAPGVTQVAGVSGKAMSFSDWRRLCSTGLSPFGNDFTVGLWAKPARVPGLWCRVGHAWAEEGAVKASASGST